MDAQRISIAEKCLKAAYDGSMAFSDIVATLIGDGFEGYTVDYRRNMSTYYLLNGDSIELPNEKTAGAVAAEFKAAVVEAAVREAQANRSGYTYKGFCEKVKVAGCAGYIVSFLGKRVVYFGRTAETHVEHFPQ